jgi:hypothetical protein
MKTRQARVAVLLGAAGAVTMAALTLSFDNTTAHAVSPMSGGAGATSTMDTPAPRPDTPAATPQLKSPGWSGGDWIGSGPFRGNHQWVPG